VFARECSEEYSSAQTNVKTNRALNAGKEEERLTGVICRDS